MELDDLDDAYDDGGVFDLDAAVDDLTRTGRQLAACGTGGGALVEEVAQWSAKETSSLTTAFETLASSASASALSGLTEQVSNYVTTELFGTAEMARKALGGIGTLRVGEIDATRVGGIAAMRVGVIDTTRVGGMLTAVVDSHHETVARMTGSITESFARMYHEPISSRLSELFPQTSAIAQMSQATLAQITDPWRDQITAMSEIGSMMESMTLATSAAALEELYASPALEPYRPSLARSAPVVIESYDDDVFDGLADDEPDLPGLLAQVASTLVEVNIAVQELRDLVAQSSVDESTRVRYLKAANVLLVRLIMLAGLWFTWQNWLNGWR